MNTKKAIKVINNHYKLFNEDPVDGVSIGFKDGDLFTWNLTIQGPRDTLYEGGFFRARMTFPKDYPFNPPTFHFLTPLYHPNVYPDGKMCISILHPPGDDKWGYEDAEERWRPVHTVNSILLSIISVLSSPNDFSPANVDAGVDWRTNKELFRKKVNKCVRDSLDYLD